MDTTVYGTPSEQPAALPTVLEIVQPQSSATQAGEAAAAPEPGPAEPQRAAGGAAEPDEKAVTLVRKHFLLGWAIAELRARLSLPPEAEHADRVSAADRLAAQLWRGSLWRIWFDRVSSLHAELGIDGPPKDGRYDPGAQRPPYAYMARGRDIARSGMIPAADVPGQMDGSRLREAAQRTINCLDLLYLDPDLMVNNDQLRTDKQALEDEIREPSPAQPAAGDASSTETPAPPPVPNANVAAKREPIVRVRHDALVLLDLWSGYLRERLANNAKDRNSATLLVAYLSGQAMASLSWNLTSKMKNPTKGADKDVAARDAEVAESAPDPVREAFKDAFDDRTIGYLQHQLAVLGSSLGEADARVIRIVIRSLKIWARAVDWLKGLDTDDPILGNKPAFDDGLHTALVDQTSIWQALVLGEEKVDAFTATGLTNDLRSDVAKLVATAITPQQIGDLERTVIDQAQAALLPLQREVTDAIGAIGDNIREPIEKLGENLLRKALPAAIAIGGTLVLLIVVTAIFGTALQTAFSSVGALLVGAMSWFQLSKHNDAATQAAGTAVNNVQGQVSSAANTAKDTVATAVSQVQKSVEDAAKSAQTELQKTAQTASDIVHKAVQEAQAGTQRAINELDADLREQECILAITYPLVEYVLSRTHNAQAAGVSPQSLSATFLMTVLWNKQDREHEALKVAYAAFGITGMVAVSNSLSKEGSPPNDQAATPAVVPVAVGEGDHTQAARTSG